MYNEGNGLTAETIFINKDDRYSNKMLISLFANEDNRSDLRQGAARRKPPQKNILSESPISAGHNSLHWTYLVKYC